MVRLSSLALLFLNVAAVAAYSPLWSDRSNAVLKSADVSSSSSVEVSRREAFLSTLAASAAVMTLNPTQAFAAESLEDYKDELLGFSLKVPAGWEKSMQTLPDRRKIALYIKPDSNQKTLLFLAYTPVRDDYTSLGSFGSVEEVGQATILPKSTLAGVEGVESKMFSSESKKQAYFFDYMTKVPSQPTTHFQTIFSLMPKISGGAAGNVLLTITAQTPESEYDSLKPVFDEIIGSYKPK